MASQFDIQPSEFAGLDPASRAQVKATLSLRQALFDILGSYPQSNVLPYFYNFTLNNLNSNAVTAGATVQALIKVSADAAFVGMSVRGKSTGDYLAFMRTDASDRQMQNLPTINGALVGTGERPAPLHKPLLLPANTTLSFDITDLSGETNEIYFTIAGFKLYNPRAQ